MLQVKETFVRVKQLTQSLELRRPIVRPDVIPEDHRHRQRIAEEQDHRPQRLLIRRHSISDVRRDLSDGSAGNRSRHNLVPIVSFAPPPFLARDRFFAIRV